MNNNRTDKEALDFVSSDLKNRYFWIQDISYPTSEDYKIDLTLTSEYGVFPVEVKSSKHDIKYGEDWNPYFCADNTSGGILRYSCFSDTLDPGKVDFNDKTLPDGYKGKHVYMINASTRGKDGKPMILSRSCKYVQMIKNESLLIYVSRGGYLIWDPKALQDSFLGFCWTKCYHTEYFRKDNTQELELKALFAFEGAKWIEADVPERIFN
jgi:hypothetical protein